MTYRRLIAFSCLTVAALAMLVAAGPPAYASASVRVVATDPPAGHNLSAGSTLYVRLQYQSDVPLRMQVKGFRDGAEVQGQVRWNPAPAYPAGSGEAIVWIAYQEPTRIDDLRVEVFDAQWKALDVVREAHPVTWTEIRAAEPTRAEWVRRLSDAQQAAVAPPSEPRRGGLSLFDLLMWTIPGYFVLQPLFGLRWSGGWRLAGLAPLVVMLPLAIHAVLALAAGSNLWPLLVILTAPFCFFYLCAVAAVRFVATGRV